VTRRVSAPVLVGALLGVPIGLVLLAGTPATASSTSVQAAQATTTAAAVGGLLPAAHVARDGATLTTLADGRVLAVGGDPGSDGAADIYDPSTRSWTRTAASPNERRTGSAAVRLPDGKVLFVGGYSADIPASGTPVAAAAVRYDPVANTWLTSAQPKERRDGPSALLDKDGTVLVLGGGPTVVERFTPSTGGWTSIGSLEIDSPGPVVRLSGGDFLYVSRGSVMRQVLSGGVRPVGSADFSGGVTRLVVRPDGRVLATAIDQGESPDNRYLSRCPSCTRLYDPVADAWRQAGSDVSGPTGRSAIPLALPDGRVLWAGGSRDQASVAVTLQDPTTDLWQRLPDLTIGRRLPASAWAGDGSVVVLGGAGPDLSGELVVPPAAPTPVTQPLGAPLRHLTATFRDELAGLYLLAHLAERDGTPVGGAPVQVWRRPAATAAWTLVGQATTDAAGAVAVPDARPTDPVVYALRAPGRDGHASAGTADMSWSPYVLPVTGPDSLVLEAGEDVVRASWLPPPVTTGPVSGYRVGLVDSTSGARTLKDVAADERDTVFTGLATGHTYTASVDALVAGAWAGNRKATEPVTTGTGQRLALDPLPDQQVLCGRLPYGETRLLSGSGPVHLCRAGLVVGAGSALVLDASTGPVSVLAHGGAGVRLDGGDVRTAGLPEVVPSPLVVLDAADPAQRWGGLLLPDDVARVDLRGVLVQHARRGVVATASRSVELRDSSIRDVAGPGITVDGTPLFRLHGVDLAGAGSGVSTVSPFDVHCVVEVVDSRIRDVPAPGLSVVGGAPVLRHVTVTGTTVAQDAKPAPAIVLNGTALAPGVGGTYDDVRGGGNTLDAVQLNSVRMTSDVTWPSLVSGTSAAPVPLGFVPVVLTMAPGTTLTVPAGTTVVAQPAIGGFVLDHASLSAQPGSVFTSTSDPEAPLDLCRSTLGGGRCEGRPDDWAGITVQGGGSVVLSGARVRFARAAVAMSRMPGQSASDGPQPVTVQLSDTDIGPGGSAVLTNQSWDPVDASVTVTGGTLHDLTGPALDVGSTTHLTGVHVADTGQLRVLGSRDPQADDARLRDTPAPDDVVIDSSTFDRTAGLVLERLTHPRLHSVVVRGTTPYGDSRGRAVALLNSTVSPARDLDGVTGSGNPGDAIALSGVLTSDLAWTTPVSSTADHPLGHILGGPLTVLGGGRVVLPAGAVVKADPASSLRLLDASLDGSAGGAVLSPTYSNFGWAGIQATASRSYLNGIVTRWPAGSITLTGAQVSGAGISVAGITNTGVPEQPSGSLVLTSTKVTGPVTADSATQLTALDTSAQLLFVRAATHVRVEHLSVVTHVSIDSGTTSSMSVAEAAPPHVDLVLRDVTVTAPDGPAVSLRRVSTWIGPGGLVDGLRGAGPNALLLLDQVVQERSLTWTGPSDDTAVHPLGVTGYQVLVRGSVTVPAGAQVPVDDLTVRGGALDASAGGASFGTRANLGRCAWSSTCTYGFGTTVTMSPDPATGTYGRATLTGARVQGALRLVGAQVDGTTVLGWVSLSGPSTVTGSSMYGLWTGSGSVEVRRTRITQDPGPDPSSGVSAHGTSLLLDHVEVDGIRAPGSFFPPVRADGGAALRMSCTEIADGAGGVLLDGAATLAMSDSNLYGGTAADSSTRDLAMRTGSTTTSTRVWWGQPGGPLPGQVDPRAALTDTDPAADKAPCASVDGPPAPATTTPPPPLPVAVVSTPPAVTRTTSGSVTMTATVNGLPATDVTYRCAVDAAAAAICVSPYAWTGLAAGSHSLVVTPVASDGRAGLPVTRAWLVDLTAPTASLTALARATTATTAGLVWSGADTGSGVASYDVRYKSAPDTGTYGAYAYPTTAPMAWQATTVTSGTLALTAGYETCISVRARDKAGNVGAWSIDRCTARALDERMLVAGAGWTRVADAGYYAGTRSTTTTTGATLSRTVSGRFLYLVATTCPTCGTVGVYVNGVLVRQVSLVETTTHLQRVLLAADLGSTASRSVVLKSMSTKTVHMDGLAVARW
jgi:hypothetical protein